MVRRAPLLLVCGLSAFNLMCSSAAEPDSTGMSGGGTVGVGGTPANTGGSGVAIGGSSSGVNTGGATATGGATGGGAAGDAAVGGTGGVAGSAGGTAGASGATEAGGTAGAAGAGGASGGKITVPTPTAGCTAPFPTDEPQTWIENPAEADRRYFVRLPEGYDHTTLYPIVFYGPGCGAGNVENTPMMGEISTEAIHVFLLQQDGCFDTGDYPSPEVPYFIQALDETQAKYCTDASQVFVSGYSSGGWLSHVIACGAGDRVRGIGSAAGGLQRDIVEGYGCATSPKMAGVLYVGADDNTNPAVELDETGYNQGVEGARDRMITANGCDPAVSEPWTNTLDVDYCTIWKTGCEDNPVVYCVPPGVGHNSNGGVVSQRGFWEFWKSLSAP